MRNYLSKEDEDRRTVALETIATELERVSRTLQDIAMVGGGLATVLGTRSQAAEAAARTVVTYLEEAIEESNK